MKQFKHESNVIIKKNSITYYLKKEDKLIKKGKDN